MALTKAQCKLVKIYNEYDYANGNPYIAYYPGSAGRMANPAGWRIIWPEHSLSDRWYDHGHMVFDVYKREDKQSQFEECYANFVILFGSTHVVKTPFGSFMDEEFVKSRNKEIQNIIKGNKPNE